MKNYFKLIIFMILFASIFYFSCGKPCRKEGIERCEAHPLYLKYFGAYQIGNYWLFESEISALRDSLFVESVSKAGSELNEVTCEEYSVFSFVGMLFNSGNAFRLFNPSFRHLNSCNKGIIRFYYKIPNDKENISIHIINNAIISENAEVLPEILINNTIYNDVLYIYEDLREYFFAPQIGLIRYTIPDSNNILITFNLKSYFIQ